MSKQDGTLNTTLQRPTTNEEEAWKAYWKAQGQEWRTEPEIDAERQKYLTERLSITPNIEQGIFPFKDIKLIRADVEWLLATHENGQGPIDWSDVSQRKREGLDLRGANFFTRVAILGYSVCICFQAINNKHLRKGMFTCVLRLFPIFTVNVLPLIR